MKPNIFSIATKELSQDAFIAWLLQWADPKNQQYDAELHQCGVAFLKALLAKKEIELSADVESIRVQRQYEDVDVFVWLNLRNGKNFVIVIEDKISAGLHGNQLVKYKKTAEKEAILNNAEIVLIYTKTRHESGYSLNKVGTNDFVIFGIGDFIDFFKDKNPSNNIFKDFSENLINIYQLSASFSTVLIGEWHKMKEIHKGFLVELEKTERIYSWSYVNNRSGGFWCGNVNWHRWGGDSFPLMLQMENQKLMFKINLNPIDLGGVMLNPYQKSRLRNYWFEHISLKAKSLDDTTVKRPKRFGNGESMTFAYVNSEHWLGLPEERVNMDFVKERIDYYLNMLKTCMTENPVPQEFKDWLRKD